MLRRLRGRSKSAAHYNFYVWEGGCYVQVDGGTHWSDGEAASLATAAHDARPLPERPLSLDQPHLHVVREDGVHILTLELPSRAAA